jgi:hypothetical protein
MLLSWPIDSVCEPVAVAPLLVRVQCREVFEFWNDSVEVPAPDVIHEFGELLLGR